MQVEDFDDVSRALEEIKTDLDEHANDQERVNSERREQIEELQEEKSTLERTVSNLEDRIRELSEQVTVLERRALHTSTERAELEVCTQAEQDYAGRSLRLFELARMRLSKAERDRKDSSLRQAEGMAQQLATAEDELVAAAKALVELEDRNPREPSHQQAAEAYKKAKRWRDHCQGGTNTSDWSQRIATLQSELDEDERIRAKHDDELRSCRADYLKLRRALHTKLQQAVDSGAVLPVWFSTVLGPGPPAHATEQWVKTAVDVLAYRAIFGVSDQIVALGPENGPDSDGAIQRSWRHTVAQQLAGHRSKLS